MPPFSRRLASSGAEFQASLFNARERRKSLEGTPELARTHFIRGTAAMAVATIDTGALFPSRDGLITFKAAILITANAGVHRGLVFEFGDTAAGCALWVGDQTIGFHAGAAGTADGATALFSYGAELPPGWRIDLIAAVRVGDGRVRLWGNGHELARAQATNEIFTPLEWSSSGAGSFAANESGTAVSDVPAGSSQAPAGFTVVEGLSVYVNQVPRHFVLMAFVVETSSGTPGANSNCSIEFIDEYLEERNRSEENGWSDSTTAEKQACAVAGTDYIETSFSERFKGWRALQVIAGREASGLLSLTGLPTALQTLTVGIKVYRLVSALLVENDVLIGADEIETVINLRDAINQAGTDFGTTVHEDTQLNYEAVALEDGTDLIVMARTKGLSGNLIAFAETMSNATANGSGFLSGGLDESEQLLSFPRGGLYTRDGRLVIGMPLNVKKATAEYAVRAKAATLAPDPAVDERLVPVVRKREKVGPIEEETQYAEGGLATLIKPYPAADRLLAEYLIPAGGTFRA